MEGEAERSKHCRATAAPGFSVFQSKFSVYYQIFPYNMEVPPTLAGKWLMITGAAGERPPPPSNCRIQPFALCRGRKMRFRAKMLDITSITHLSSKKQYHIDSDIDLRCCMVRGRQWPLWNALLCMQLQFVIPTCTLGTFFYKSYYFYTYSLQ